MKKLTAMIVCGCLALSLISCATRTPKAPQRSATEEVPSVSDTFSATQPVDTAAPMYAVALPTTKETVHAEDGTALFSLSFQQVQLILNDEALEERIAANLHERIASLQSSASDIVAQAQLDYPQSDCWSEYFIDAAYTPTRLDHSVLSLFGNTVSYQGGPHPSLVTDSVTYDLQSGNAVYLDDILTEECTPERLYQLILDSLEKQAEDLYCDYADAVGDRFTGELHSIQDWYFSRTGLCFHFAPYDIAPYSSGTIIAELPYSALDGILKEKYFPIEPDSATGSVYAETFIEDDSERFDNIAQISLCEDGSEVLLYPDAFITDLRIEVGSLYTDSNLFFASATVFAASSVNVGEAIHLSADLHSEDTVLRLVYHSNQKESSAFITYDELGDSILLTNG